MCRSLMQCYRGHSSLLEKAACRGQRAQLCAISGSGSPMRSGPLYGLDIGHLLDTKTGGGSKLLKSLALPSGTNLISEINRFANFRGGLRRSMTHWIYFDFSKIGKLLLS